MDQKIILVDRNDNPIGLEEKIKTHKEGLLHRAISVYIFNSKNELLLQQRALKVYHSGSLWSNTCCSNCYEGESADYSAHRSLKSEMGIECEIKQYFTTIYRTPVSNGLIEHEFLHVFFGRYDDDPKVNSDEVMNWRWMDFDKLVEDIKKNGSIYSPWLKILLYESILKEEVKKFLKS